MSDKISRTSESKLLYRIEECAELLSLSRAQLYRLIDQGDLEVLKVGRSTRVSLSQLNLFIERLERISKMSVIH